LHGHLLLTLYRGDETVFAYCGCSASHRKNHQKPSLEEKICYKIIYLHLYL